MANKIEPFVRSTIAAALGMEEDDLSNAIIQQINEQSTPEGLLETLEPVSDCVSVPWLFTSLKSRFPMHLGPGRRRGSGCEQRLASACF